MRFTPRKLLPTGLVVAFIVAIATATTGCQTLSGASDVADNPRAEALVRTTVQYAVMRAVGQDAERAAEIVDIASQAITLAKSDETTTTAALEQAVRDNIDFADLAPSERVLADNLIVLVKSEIEQRLQDNTLDGDAVVKVVAILTWVKDAAASVASDTG